MGCAASESFWAVYALTGRPDFLNYLRRGDVTWRELWDFYRRNQAPSEAVLRLCGLFHIFLSSEYDRCGCVLDPDSSLYQSLHEWSEFALDCGSFVPEEEHRESLTGLLGQSLISPLYYEAVFNAYLEAASSRGECLPSETEGHLAVATSSRRLRVLLPGLAGAGARYTGWNQSFVLAMGEDDEEDWADSGGEG